MSGLEAFSTAYLPIQTARASAVLLAAGAYDAAPVEILCPNADRFLLFAEYTRGALSGSVSFLIEYSPYSSDQVGVTNWFQLGSLIKSSAIGVDRIEFVQRDTILYVSTSANLESFTVGPIPLFGVIQRVRISAAEVGVIGTPGTAAIIATFWFQN